MVPTSETSAEVSTELSTDRLLADRQILFFPGLPQHYRRLAPLIRRLRSLGADVICATTQNVNFGCDFKGDLEAPLVREGQRYLFLPEQFEAEVANTLVLDYRRAERTIAEGVRTVPEWSNRLAVAAVRLRTIMALEHDRLVQKLLDHVEPELVLVVNEYNCWTRMLCTQALAQNIAVLSFSEGLPYETHPPDMFNGRFSSKICVWGQAHYRQLLEHGADGEKIVVTGAMHLDSVRDDYLSRVGELRRQLDLPEDRTILLLIMPRLCYLPPAKEIIASLTTFLNEHPDYFLAVKWHYQERIEDIDRVGVHGDQIRRFQYEDILPLIAACDVALCSGSAAGAEALAFGKPLIEINWGGKNVNLSYTDHGVANEIRSPDDIHVIERIVKEGVQPSVRDAADRFVTDTFHTLDHRCVDRAVEQVLALLA